MIFTSNDTPAEEFVKARDLQAIINLDDIGYEISYFGRSCAHTVPDTSNSSNKPQVCPVSTIAGLGKYRARISRAILELVCLRFNPGPERVGNTIIGNPVEAKFGVTRAQLRTGYSALKAKGVKRYVARADQ